MTAIPHAARALTSALGRFELASARLLEAATGAGGTDDVVTPLAEVLLAKAQANASFTALQFSNDMWTALLDLQRETAQSADS